MTTITGIILDSTGSPANGRLYVRQGSRFNTDAGLVTQAQATALVVEGVPTKADRSGPLTIPPTPPDSAVEIIEDFQDGRTVARWVTVPNVDSVGYSDLPDLIPPSAADVVPAWVRQVKEAAEGVNLGVANAAAYAASAASARDAAATSATAASASASDAAASATSAASERTAAAASAAAAVAAKNAAGSEAGAAYDWAQQAATKATAAGSAAAAAAGSATAAASSATDAASSATAAAGSATSALGHTSDAQAAVTAAEGFRDQAQTQAQGAFIAEAGAVAARSGAEAAAAAAQAAITLRAIFGGAPRIGDWLGGITTGSSGGASQTALASGVQCGTLIVVTAPITIDALAFTVVTAEAGKSARPMLYDTDPATGWPRNLVAHAVGSAAATGSVDAVLASPVELPAGVYWGFLRSDGTTARFTVRPAAAQPYNQISRAESPGAPAAFDPGTFAAPAAQLSFVSTSLNNVRPWIAIRRSA